MKTIDYKHGFVAIHCKGCDEIHPIAVGVTLPNGSGPWGFNRNYDKPTFTPSVNIHWEAIDRPEIGLKKHARRCHFIVTDGNIQYCGDCTHSLSGQTIELPELTESDI